MIIDSHTHLGSHDGGKVTEHDLLKSMDQAGIAMSLIVAEHDPIHNISNLDNLLTIAKKQPRLKIIGDCIYETLDNHQINKLINLVKAKKIIGLKFYLGYEAFYPLDKKLFRLYTFCQENHVPVVFHTGMLEIGMPGQLKYAHPLHIDELASHFPTLTIIAAHMGNPWLLDCAAVMARNKNVYTDISGFFDENKPIPSEDITIFVNRISEMELFLGSYEKFLFGTDWPLYNQTEYLQVIEALGLTEKEKELVMWKNAKEIFHLAL